MRASASPLYLVQKTDCTAVYIRLAESFGAGSHAFEAQRELWRNRDKAKLQFYFSYSCVFLIIFSVANIATPKYPGNNRTKLQSN
jgi:hypothetical protein